MLNSATARALRERDRGGSGTTLPSDPPTPFPRTRSTRVTATALGLYVWHRVRAAFVRVWWRMEREMGERPKDTACVEARVTAASTTHSHC